MPNGIVKFFNVAKGFGFITPDGGGKDVFVPAASAVSAGVPGLKAGQLVSFDEQPDGKGPKAINLKLLASPPPPPPKPVRQDPNPLPREEERTQLTFYHGPDCGTSRKILAELRAAGYEPRVVDYIATPPTKDELKSLSIRLRGSDQSLVRKYDPLFQELRLDDRFISESEFWGAIAENPSLINGPVVATATKAGICRADNAVQSFLAGISPNGIAVSPKPKRVPEPVLRLVTDEVAPTSVVNEPAAKESAVKEPIAEGPTTKRKMAKKVETKPTGKVPQKTKAAVTKKAATEKTKTKSASKPLKNPAKKIARTPVKKSGRKLGT